MSKVNLDRPRKSPVLNPKFKIEIRNPKKFIMFAFV